MRFSDLRSIIFVCVTLALLLVPFLLGPLPVFIEFCLVMTNATFVFACCVINHNHLHCPTFSRQWLNRIFNAILTLAKGHTAMTIVVPHNLNHHVYQGREQDWIRTELAGPGRLGIRLIRYVWNASRTMSAQRKLPNAPQLQASEKWSQITERIALYTFIVLLAVWEPRKAVVFVTIPWLIGMAALVAVNLLQHDGCDPDSQFDHSRNFTGFFGNWFLFNNGYHTAHHLFPDAHWSLLPELHEKFVKSKIRPDLEQPSILAFALKEHFASEQPL